MARKIKFGEALEAMQDLFGQGSLTSSKDAEKIKPVVRHQRLVKVSNEMSDSDDASVCLSSQVIGNLDDESDVVSTWLSSQERKDLEDELEAIRKQRRSISSDGSHVDHDLVEDIISVAQSDPDEIRKACKKLDDRSNDLLFDKRAFDKRESERFNTPCEEQLSSYKKQLDYCLNNPRDAEAQSQFDSSYGQMDALFLNSSYLKRRIEVERQRLEYDREFVRLQDTRSELLLRAGKIEYKQRRQSRIRQSCGNAAQTTVPSDTDMTSSVSQGQPPLQPNELERGYHQELKSKQQTQQNLGGHMGSSVYGIDLGTTYSCIAYIDETGNPVVVNNMEGSNTTPSVVCFEEGGGVTVGQVAKDGAVFAPGRTVSFVKRSMGKTDVVIYADGARSPEEVSSYILRKVAGDAAKITNLEVKDVVITVPAYFGDAERNATKVAGELAGLNVLQIVQEPVAAAIYYGATKSDEDTTALVYDLGGGTFDVNVIQVKHEDEGVNLAVKWTDGDASLGGCDWDAVLVQRLQTEFRNQLGFDDDFDDDAVEQFQSAAEAAKKALTLKESHKVTINVGGMPARITITRDEFNELTSHLLRRTINLTKSCFEQAREKADVTVDKILLVGGSTRMPQVEEALRAEFPNLPIELADPDEAVAKGAALCALDAAVTVVEAQRVGAAPSTALPAAEISEDNVARKLQLGAARNVIQYATSKSYGVWTVGDTIVHLILKNQPIPTDTHCVENAMDFETYEANQTSAEIKVFETDSLEEHMSYDGAFEPIKVQVLELGSANLPKGAPVRISFKLNEEGLLSITAIDVTSGKSLDFDVQVSKGLSGDKLESVKARALSMAVE